MRLIWAGLVVRMEKRRSTFKILTGKSSRKAPLWRRWKNNIKMDLTEICVNSRNWVDTAQHTIIGEPL